MTRDAIRRVAVGIVVSWCLAALATAQRRQPAGVSASPSVGVVKDCPDCPELLVVPAGALRMGSPPDELDRDVDEGPQHAVTIARAFAAGRYEVTFDEWDACVSGGRCVAVADDGWGRGRRPVIHVTYRQAIDYTAWLSERTGKSYRLLSEAEWEYAARAGSQTARYWGASADRACAFENGADASLGRQKPAGWKDEWGTHACDDGHPRTAPVGAFMPNGFGLHDMLGNVAEWTEDCYTTSYEGAPTDGRAWATPSCSRRVIRGGNWSNAPAGVRSANRNGDPPTFQNMLVGFRVARTLP